MQPAEIKSLGYKLTKQVPASVEEFDKLAKETGAALREANRNVLYRSTLTQFRDTFLHGADEEKDGDTVTRPAIDGFEKLSGVERATKVKTAEKKDESGKITQEEVLTWAETEDEYFNRALAQLVKDGKYSTIEEAQAAFAPHAQAVLDSIEFDPSKTERKSAGPKKTPKTYVEVAEEIVKATGSLENGIAAFSRKTGKTVADATLEGLAKAVWEDQKAQKKQIAGSYAEA